MIDKVFNKLKYVLWLLFSLAFLSSCTPQINWKETYDANGKEPFGTYLIHHAVKEYFPNSKFHSLKSNQNYSDLLDDNNEKNLFLNIGKHNYFSEEEFYALLSSVENGSTWIVASEFFDSLFHNYFAFETDVNNEFSDHALHYTIKTNFSKYEWNMKGNHLDTYFPVTYFTLESNDSYCVVGKHLNNANALSFICGKGQIVLLSEPKLFSNLSMLDEGKKYVESILGLIEDKKFNNLYLSTYYSHDSRVSDLSILWEYESIRWAIITLLVGILVLLIFETKRRQNIIPVIEAQNNNTLSFIQTMGQLYYNEGDMNNLAEKKVVYFLDFVRSKYNLDTRLINDQFYTRLHHKSKVPLEAIKELFDIVQKVTNKWPLDSQTILQLDNYIKLFNHG